MTIVRHATSLDVERIYELIVAIAGHHNQTEFVAEHEGPIVGLVSYTINYSIWLAREYMNVDDVFVDSNCRGSGIGEALMQETRTHCGLVRISSTRWEVQRDNHSAIRFYERPGEKCAKKGCTVGICRRDA
jgi:ribosomal protein S18 acetylase RimI-like enzyme